MGKTPRNRSGTVPIKHRPDRDKWELTTYAQGKRSRSLYDTPEAAEKAWTRHTNASQLYRSYVAKLVSRDEAQRFTAILPTKNPAQVATGRGL